MLGWERKKRGGYFKATWQSPSNAPRHSFPAIYSAPFPTQLCKDTQLRMFTVAVCTLNLNRVDEHYEETIFK